MKIKVSDYIAEKLVEAGTSQVFTVTGGGAMHLNDALGHREGLHCLYNHHEQPVLLRRRAMHAFTIKLRQSASPQDQGELMRLPAWWEAGWTRSLC